MSEVFKLLCSLLPYLLFHLYLVHSSKVFYRLKDKYLNGKILKSMSVDEPTECVGMCMHTGKCMAFNVNETSDGLYTCEFLTNTRCGFVDTKPGSTIFSAHKQCNFQLRAKSNWRCITITDSGFLREASGLDACVQFNLNLDGSGFKIDNKCVAIKEERGQNKVDWLVKSDIIDEEKCQVHLQGDDDHLQIIEVSTKKCVANLKFNSYTYLVLADCGATYFKMNWGAFLDTEDKTDNITTANVEKSLGLRGSQL